MQYPRRRPIASFPLASPARFSRSVQEPDRASRRLHAGCRSAGLRTSSELSRRMGQPPVLTSPNPHFDASAAVRLRSPLSTVPAGIIVPTFPQRSPPLLLTTAACGGLGSAPDRRTRRALLHLSYSCASPFGPAMLVTQDPSATSAGSKSRSAAVSCRTSVLVLSLGSTGGTGQ